MINNAEEIHWKKRREMCKPTKEAYLFFPKGADLIEFDEENKQKTLRKIFQVKSESEYLPFEREMLKEFEDLCNSNSSSHKDTLIFPENWKIYDTLKFLQASKFVPAKAIELIKDHLSWRASMFPLKMTSSAFEILHSGFIYVHGRDNRFRPIIVVQASRYMELKEIYSYNDFVLAIVYFVEYIISNMMIPGQVETWIIIADMSEVSLFQPPTDMMSIFKILQYNYRGRLGVIYVLGMSNILNMIWKVLKVIIDPKTTKKVKFLSEQDTNEIFTYVNRSQIEEKYSGTATNVEDCPLYGGCWPPIVPNENFLKEDDKKEEILVTEDKYVEMALRGEKIIIPSPFLSDKLITFKQNEVEESYYQDVESQIDKRSESNYENFVEDTKNGHLEDNYYSIIVNTAHGNEQQHKPNEMVLTQSPQPSLRKKEMERNSLVESAISSRPFFERSDKDETSRIKKKFDIIFERESKSSCCSDDQLKLKWMCITF